MTEHACLRDLYPSQYVSLYCKTLGCFSYIATHLKHFSFL
ncbi:hypothetical protein X975_15389, partial [Stegodyphus mimosarum]